MTNRNCRELLLWITQKELIMSSIQQQRTNRLLTRQQAAKFLTELGLIMSTQTLARFFCEKKGPPCMTVARRAMYKEADLVEYMHEQCNAPRKSSSEPLRPAAAEDLPMPANDPHSRGH